MKNFLHTIGIVALTSFTSFDLAAASQVVGDRVPCPEVQGGKFDLSNKACRVNPEGQLVALLDKEIVTLDNEGNVQRTETIPQEAMNLVWGSNEVIQLNGGYRAILKAWPQISDSGKSITAIQDLTVFDENWNYQYNFKWIENDRPIFFDSNLFRVEGNRLKLLYSEEKALAIEPKLRIDLVEYRYKEVLFLDQFNSPWYEGGVDKKFFEAFYKIWESTPEEKRGCKGLFGPYSKAGLAKELKLAGITRDAYPNAFKKLCEYSVYSTEDLYTDHKAPWTLFRDYILLTNTPYVVTKYCEAGCSQTPVLFEADQATGRLTPFTQIVPMGEDEKALYKERAEAAGGHPFVTRKF